MDCRLEKKKDDVIYYIEEGQGRGPSLALGVLCVQKYLGNVSRQVQMLFLSFLAVATKCTMCFCVLS